jgi:flagellar hook-basal body complex protein FliE
MKPLAAVLTSPHLAKPKEQEVVSKDPQFGLLMDSLKEAVVQPHVDANISPEKFFQEKGMQIHQVMLSLEKAETSMKLAIGLRNRLLDAYHEIMQMGA